MVPNAFLHILGEDITAEENTVSIQERKITKLAKRLPDRANTTVSKDLLKKKTRLWQAQLEVIGDFLLPHIFHFRSSLVKPIQTSLETAWKQYSEKPEELPLHQLRSKSGELVYNKLHLNDDSPSADEECQPEETDLSIKPQGILHSSYYSSQ